MRRAPGGVAGEGARSGGSVWESLGKSWENDGFNVKKHLEMEVSSWENHRTKLKFPFCHGGTPKSSKSWIL